MAFSLMGILAVMLEAIRPFLVPLLALLCIEIALVATAVFKSRNKPLDWKGSGKIAAVMGCIGFLVALLAAPWITGASHAQLAGWLDYLALVAASAAAGVALFLALLPLLLCARPPQRRAVL
ncbi:MAG: hypothetical protein LAT63_02730 [Marinobacter sp.]|nr:hypothetical protein [Marinobacter sp.]